MVTTLPAPITFSLPEGWRSAPPDEAGAPGAAFLAVHPKPDNGFTANITISGNLHTVDVALESIADEAFETLRAGAAGRAKLGNRDRVGTPENPVLTQAVQLNLDLQGQPRELVQYQVFLGIRDKADPGRRLVLHLTLTSTMDQFPEVIDDFQKFLSTVGPEESGQDNENSRRTW